MVVSIQLEEAFDKGWCMADGAAQFIQIGAGIAEEGVLNCGAQIGQHGLAVIGNKLFPVDSILIGQGH